jgi:hypothetical protein
MKHAPKRPTCEEVKSLLVERKGLIVHFSTCPPMHSDEKDGFPGDLRRALTDPSCIRGGLSCSIVTPTDQFEGESRFVPGSIGLILKPNVPQSIISASVGDAGDTRDVRTCVAEGEMESEDISADYLCSTIDNRTTYNNWLVKEFDVLGILALPPGCVVTSFQIEGNGSIRSESKIGLHKVAAEFPCQKIYTVKEGMYMRLEQSRLTPAAYHEIWP